MDRRRDLDRLAGVIAEIQPDVIGLQEVIPDQTVRCRKLVVSGQVRSA